MKKNIYRGLFAALICLVLSACQNADHDVINPDVNESLYKAKTYTEQFQRVWQGIDVGYAFWKWETVDWDKVYDTYLPIFQEADKRVDDGQEGMSINDYKAAWTAIIQPLKDHHLYLALYRPDDQSRTVVGFSPGRARRDSADYHRSFTRKEQLATLNAMLSSGAISGHLRSDSTEAYGGGNQYLIEGMLSDGGTDSIAYLYMSSFMIYPPEFAEDSICQLYINSWIGHLLDHPNVSAILDTRGNGGGFSIWQQSIGKYFTQESFYPDISYQKCGFGRYDYAPGEPNIIKPDTAGHYRAMSETYPFVCLYDQHSASNGEEIPWMFSYLPGYASVGEPSCGAMGSLRLNNYTTMLDGTFGDERLTSNPQNATSNYYCYMSSYANVDHNTGNSPEGIGMIPDVRCTLDTTAFFSGTSDNQLLRAIELIKRRH